MFSWIRHMKNPAISGLTARESCRISRGIRIRG